MVQVVYEFWIETMQISSGCQTIALFELKQVCLSSPVDVNSIHCFKKIVDSDAFKSISIINEFFVSLKFLILYAVI